MIVPSEDTRRLAVSSADVASTVITSWDTLTKPINRSKRGPSEVTQPYKNVEERKPKKRLRFQADEDAATRRADYLTAQTAGVPHLTHDLSTVCTARAPEGIPPSCSYYHPPQPEHIQKRH